MRQARPLIERVRRLLGRVVVTSASAAAMFGVAAPPAAAQVEETCLLPVTKFDAGTLNVAYPDSSADYWIGAYSGIPGTRVRIVGEFPHSRYMSFHTYDAVTRPVDAIADFQINPDPGSTNPFRPHARRDRPNRSYTVYIEPGPRPANPAPNTLYTGGPPNFAGLFIYRIYLPDFGYDETGGVGLPRVFLEPSGGGPTPPPPIDCRHAAKPSMEAINDEIARLSPPPQADVLPIPGRNPPVFRKFVNIGTAGADTVFDNEPLGAVREALRQFPGGGSAFGSGGFVSNLHIAYVYAPTNRSFGQVLALRAMAPTFANTRPGPKRMPAGEVRFWSVCQNEPFSQRFTACLPDDQVPVHADGTYTIVISTPAQRPQNANPDCGVGWIPWGPAPDGTVIVRHMLPAPSFTEAIQNAEYGKEAATMGPYLPAGTYSSKDDFETLGCPAS